MKLPSRKNIFDNRNTKEVQTLGFLESKIEKQTSWFKPKYYQEGAQKMVKRLGVLVVFELIMQLDDKYVRI